MNRHQNAEQSSSSGAFMSSNEVVERLGISKSTLYAYVSRGLIRSEPDPESPRSRRYRTDDVERLLNRQRLRADPETATTTVLNWGSPVLESSISTIVDEQLFYRGLDACDLAQTRSFEDVVRLLWTGDPDATLPEPDRRSAGLRDSLLQGSRSVAQSLDPITRIQSLLPPLEVQDPASYDFRRESLQGAGIGVMHMFTAACTGSEGRSGVAKTLQAHWAPGQSALDELFNAALILSADHELNISTFTVRCIASARAPLYSALNGGFSALRGQKHGGATLQAAALVSEAERGTNALEVLRRRLERGEHLAGFGHRLYPQGDPRGRLLLDMLAASLPESEDVKLGKELCEAALELQGSRPTLDFGLVILSRAARLPAESPLTIMALGRIAGWIAHAIEEYGRDQLIRPRARQTESDHAKD
jgi:citrate synthase